jgi:SAM-dependent methyltransferase
MFYADPARAFANIRRALAPGGRLAFVCWREIAVNTWASVTLGIARRHIELPPAPGPDDPGPYSFRDPDRVRRILHQAGWSDISIAALESDAYMGADLDEAMANFLTMGPIANQVVAAPEDIRHAIAAELRAALPEYVTKRGVIMRAATWMVTAAA